MTVTIFIMNLESLLQIYCKKDKFKKEKIRTIFKTIEYNNDTKEYKCKSFSNLEKEYEIFYSNGSKDWFCSCPAITFKKYKTYEELEDKKLHYKNNLCIHIISVLIYRALFQK